MCGFGSCIGLPMPSSSSLSQNYAASGQIRASHGARPVDAKKCDIIPVGAISAPGCSLGGAGETGVTLRNDRPLDPIFAIPSTQVRLGWKLWMKRAVRPLRRVRDTCTSVAHGGCVACTVPRVGAYLTYSIRPATLLRIPQQHPQYPIVVFRSRICTAHTGENKKARLWCPSPAFQPSGTETFHNASAAPPPFRRSVIRRGGRGFALRGHCPDVIAAVSLALFHWAATTARSKPVFRISAGGFFGGSRAMTNALPRGRRCPAVVSIEHGGYIRRGA